MPEAAAPILERWTTFFATMCTSAAALIGLMFVVITLVTGVERLQHNPDGISTFSTPTVVHFCAALLVSAVLIAPWHSLTGADAVIGLAALCGLIYSLRIIARARRLPGYVPDLEDWAFHLVLPFIGYGAIFAGTLALYRFSQSALFVVAGGVLLLVFIGIHNAWDVVTFIATGGPTDAPPT